jgi:hypothetical protein
MCTSPTYTNFILNSRGGKVKIDHQRKFFFQGPATGFAAYRTEAVPMAPLPIFPHTCSIQTLRLSG